MHKAERLIQLWLTINQRKSFTAADLARELGVSTRTIMRDLDTLTLLGTPLYANVGRGGGYSVLRSDILPPIAFSEQEILSLFFAYTILETLSSTPFEAEVRFVKDKLYQQVPAPLLENIQQMERHIRFMSAPRTVDNRYLNQVFLASLNKTSLRLTYQTATGPIPFLLVPIGIYSYQGFWYMVAYHFDKQDYRIHRIDRILSLKESKQAIPDNLWSLNDWYESGKNQQNLITIQLQLRTAAYRKLTNQWFLAGKLEETSSDWLTLTFQTIPSQLNFIIDDILRLGSDAKVLSPLSIRQTIIKKIKEMTALYENETNPRLPL